MAGSTLQTPTHGLSTIQQHLNVAAAPAPSQPAQLMPEEGAEGSPSPSLTPPVLAGGAGG